MQFGNSGVDQEYQNLCAQVFELLGSTTSTVKGLCDDHAV
jgi:hypothetical protein